MPKTAFSFEVPLPHLQDFDDLQDFHFALSFLLQHECYANYMWSKSCFDHRQVWLDNSYNECAEADCVSSLYDKMLGCGATKVVAPDSMDWDIEKRVSAFVEMSNLVLPRYVIGVCCNTYQQVALQDAGCMHFAVPYKARLAAEGDYTVFNWAKGFHFLGLVSIIETQELQPRTLDTSMPIKLALQGKDLRQWFEEGEPHLHTRDIVDTYFTQTLSAKQLQLARNNIIMLKSLVNGED